MMAALISTISSALNSLSTVFTMDIYVKRYKPEADRKEIKKQDGWWFWQALFLYFSGHWNIFYSRVEFFQYFSIGFRIYSAAYVGSFLVCRIVEKDVAQSHKSSTFIGDGF